MLKYKKIEHNEAVWGERSIGMYCRNCGKMVKDNAVFCYNCGNRLIDIQTAVPMDDEFQIQEKTNDQPSFWFALLAFFFPIGGLILWLIYEDKKPKRARSLKRGMIIGLAGKIIFLILWFFLVALSLRTKTYYF